MSVAATISRSATLLRALGGWLPALTLVLGLLPVAATAAAEAEVASDGIAPAPGPRTVEPPLPLHTIVVRPEPPPLAPLAATDTIDLSLRDADLVEVLRSFARLGGFDLVVHPTVRGTVTVELHDVRWQAALAMILRSQGLAAEIDGTIVAVDRLPVAR